MMNSKRKKPYRAAVVLVVILAILFIFRFSDKETVAAPNSPINLLALKNSSVQRKIANENPPSYSLNQIINEQVTQQPQPSYDKEQGDKFIACLTQIFKKAREACDDECIIQFLQKNGSNEAHKYIADGFFKSNGEEIKKIKNAQSKLGRFHLALFHARLLEQYPGPEMPTPNYRFAESLLQELIREEPQNAALYLYLAVAAFEQEKETKAIAILNEMVHRSTYYDEYFTSWRQDFQRSEYALNSAFMIEAFGQYDYPPVRPNLYSVVQMQEKLDFDFKPLGRIMIKDALSFNLVYDNNFDWDYLSNFYIF